MAATGFQMSSETLCLSQSLDSIPGLEIFRELTAQSLDTTSFSNHLGSMAWYFFVEYLLCNCSDETTAHKVCLSL